MNLEKVKSVYKDWKGAVKGVLSLGLVVSLAAGALQRSCSHVASFSNRYEAAQHKTVLIATKESQGTGIVVKRKNDLGQTRVFVWTAAHVIGDEVKADVKIEIRNDYHRVGETKFTGSVIAISKLVDVAVLWVDAPESYFVGAEFASEVPLPVGSAVYHVGNFLGTDFDNSVSTGVVSQLGVKPGDGFPWPVADQFTSLVIPGSSGGPVFDDSNDKVVGVAVGSVMRSFFFYVPTRALSVFADNNFVGFAFRGSDCPSDATLRALIIKPKPVADVIRIFSVQ